VLCHYLRHRHAAGDTLRAFSFTLAFVAQGAHWLKITLDGEHAAKLARLAERTHVQEGTLARSLLAHALDEADSDPRNVADLLDAIPGAYERAQLGLSQANAGQTVSLDEVARRPRD
jgi:enoyl reductase-like protein